MTDSELRGLVLRRFYDRRLELMVSIELSDFDNRFSLFELQNICQQLDEKGLIGQWKPMVTKGKFVGNGQITAEGVDVVEGNAKPPISITFDQRSTVSVTSSQNVQIGSHNIQDVQVQLEALVQAIDASSASARDKAEAKSLLKQFLAHPVVAAIIGGLASTL